MSSYIQLFILIFSFIYGYLVKKLMKMNSVLLKGSKIVWVFLWPIFLNMMALLYVLVLYKICDGMVNYYFI